VAFRRIRDNNVRILLVDSLVWLIRVESVSSFPRIKFVIVKNCGECGVLFLVDFCVVVWHEI